jgi:hypothetical protein
MAYKFDKADIANRNFAYQGAKLAQAKSDSNFWGSWRGTVNKLPGAMKDTFMNALKKKAKK